MLRRYRDLIASSTMKLEMKGAAGGEWMRAYLSSSLILEN